MNYLTLLNQTVSANLGSLSDAHDPHSGRIGTPVFVRWTAAVAESQEVLKTQLAEMTLYTGRWLSAKLCRLYATGTQTQGHLSLALEYVSGSSALLALTLAHHRPHISLAIYGTHGALYHNDFIAPTRDGALSPLPTGARPEDGALNEFAQESRRFLDAIEQSLALHQPVDLVRTGARQ